MNNYTCSCFTEVTGFSGRNCEICRFNKTKNITCRVDWHQPMCFCSFLLEVTCFIVMFCIDGVCDVAELVGTPFLVPTITLLNLTIAILLIK